MDSNFLKWYLKNGGDVAHYYGVIYMIEPQIKRVANPNLKKYNHKFNLSCNN